MRLDREWRVQEEDYYTLLQLAKDFVGSEETPGKEPIAIVLGDLIPRSGPCYAETIGRTMG